MKLDVQIKNCSEYGNDFYFKLNGKNINLNKIPQGRAGIIEVSDGENIIEIRKKYYLDNSMGIFGVGFLWIKFLITENIGSNISLDGKYAYRFKMKFNLKSDSKAKFYIVDKRSSMVDPVSCEIFSSTEYDIIENDSIINDEVPINYTFCKLLRYVVTMMVIVTFIYVYIN